MSSVIIFQTSLYLGWCRVHDNPLQIHVSVKLRWWNQQTASSRCV